MASESRQDRRRQQRLTRRQRAELDARRRRTQRLFVFAIGAAVIVAIALIVVNQIVRDDGDDGFPTVQAAPATYPNVPQDRLTLGNPDAPVRLVEWSDFQ